MTSNLPSCVGAFEVGDIVCNGDPKGKELADRAFCAWRDRCAGLQLYCRSAGLNVKDCITKNSPATIIEICENIIIEQSIAYGIPNGEEKMQEILTDEKRSLKLLTPEQTKGHRRKRRQAKSRGVRKPKTALKKELLEMAQHFEQQLRDHFPNNRFSTGKKVLIRPGIIYLVDRTRGSHYLAWYCTRKGKRDQALANLKFAPRIGAIDVMLPVEIDTIKKMFSKNTWQKLNMKTLHIGQFKTKCMHMKKEGLGICAEILSALAREEKISLS